MSDSWMRLDEERCAIAFGVHDFCLALAQGPGGLPAVQRACKFRVKRRARGLYDVTASFRHEQDLRHVALTVFARGAFPKSGETYRPYEGLEIRGIALAREESSTVHRIDVSAEHLTGLRGRFALLAIMPETPISGSVAVVCKHQNQYELRTSGESEQSAPDGPVIVVIVHPAVPFTTAAQLEHAWAECAAKRIALAASLRARAAAGRRSSCGCEPEELLIG